MREIDALLRDPVQLKSLIGEIAMRIAHHVANIPYEEVVTAEALLGDAREKPA